LTEAEEFLSQFKEKKSTRPLIIEMIFSLVFGKNAAIESSKGFEKLKQKQWYVILTG
jgi:hypothetical protein